MLVTVVCPWLTAVSHYMHWELPLWWGMEEGEKEHICASGSTLNGRHGSAHVSDTPFAPTLTVRVSQHTKYVHIAFCVLL